MRGICGQKKIGHTGTLDPDAEGVLPVCLGKATKVCDMLTDSDKVYRAVMQLGIETDTQDLTGTVLSACEVPVLTETEIRDVIRTFQGEIMQVPPMYSALKVNGKKLCDLARAGVTVERKARPVTIYEIRIERVELPENLQLCMTEFHPTYVPHPIQTLQPVNGADFSLPVEQVFFVYPVLTAKPVFDVMLKNGNKMAPEQFAEYIVPQNGMLVRVRMSDGRFAAVYEYQETLGLYRPSKMFLED